MNKQELIKEFNKYHPGYGVEWGYSTYIGGMTDSGHWLTDVLLNEPIDTLKFRLSILNRQQEENDEFNKKRLEEYERVKQLTVAEQEEYYRNQEQEIKKRFE